MIPFDPLSFYMAIVRIANEIENLIRSLCHESRSWAKIKANRREKFSLRHQSENHSLIMSHYLYIKISVILGFSEHEQCLELRVFRTKIETLSQRESFHTTEKRNKILFERLYCGRFWNCSIPFAVHRFDAHNWCAQFPGRIQIEKPSKLQNIKFPIRSVSSTILASEIFYVSEYVYSIVTMKISWHIVFKKHEHPLSSYKSLLESSTKNSSHMCRVSGILKI